MKRLLKEPLIHFLVLGGGLFLLFSFMRGGEGEEDAPQNEVPRSISKEIKVTKGDIESFVARYKKVWQRAPTEKELAGLIEKYIHEEVMYRQALELGLDLDDTIVKRRMRQKLEFFTDDIAALAEPTDEDLSGYLESHPDPYRRDSKFTFKQVYFKAKNGADSLEEEMKSQLASLRAAGASADISKAGNSLILEQTFEATSQRDVGRKFGEDFAQSLLTVEVGSWQGPIKSGFGLHLVFISERIDGMLPPLEEIRDAVARDWAGAKRKESNEAIYEKWRAEYKVTVEDYSQNKESEVTRK